MTTSSSAPQRHADRTMGAFSAWRRLDVCSIGGSRLLPLQARATVKHRANRNP
jgi:hypothetical protein